MKCPMCEGVGGWSEDFGEGTILYDKCPYCKKGKISVFKWVRNEIWQYLTCFDWFVSVLDWFYDRRKQ